MGVVHALPDAEELHRVAVAQPVGDEEVPVLGLQHVREGNEVLVALGEDGDGNALDLDAVSGGLRHGLARLTESPSVGYRQYSRVRIWSYARDDPSEITTVDGEAGHGGVLCHDVRSGAEDMFVATDVIIPRRRSTALTIANPHRKQKRHTRHRPGPMEA